jgi:hypothetical protein
MDNIFLVGLKNPQLQLLNRHDVPYYDLSIGKENGVVIDAALMVVVLNILGSCMTSRQPTDYEGIERITIATIPRVSAANTGFQIWADRDKDLNAAAVALLSETFSPRILRDIHLHCGPTPQLAAPDGKFHIHLWTVSGEDRTRGRATGNSVWGFPIKASYRYACQTRVPGNPIASADGLVVADLVGDSDLFIYLDLVKTSDWKRPIFEEILRRAAQMLMSPEESQIRARQLFVEYSSRALALALAHTTETAGEHKGRAKVVGKQLAAEVRQGAESEHKLLDRLGMHQEAIGAEYDNLLNIPKVRDVRVEGSNIVVLTEVLNCKDDRTGRMHEIGAFQILIPFAGDSPRWKNLTRTVSGYQGGQHAPHVWSDGRACLGNTADLFPDLIGKGQYAIAAQLAIEFVQTANTSDPAGKHVNQWPYASSSSSAPPAPTGPRQLDATHQTYKQQYVNACSKREDEDGAFKQKDLVKRRAVVEQLQVRLILELRAAMLAERKAKGVKACDRSALFDEFDTLTSLPKVASVNVENGVILVTTDMLSCANPDTGARHDIGRFLIKIFINGQGDSVRWHNLDAAQNAGRKGQQAPLVLASGRALFSDMRENFPDLIAQMQFGAAAMLAIDSIEQISGEDPNVEFLNKWPVAHD